MAELGFKLSLSPKLYFVLFFPQFYAVVVGRCGRSVAAPLPGPGLGTCCFVFFSASPFSLSKHMLAQSFFRWFGLSLLHYSHKWVILPASYTSSPCWVPRVHRYWAHLLLWILTSIWGHFLLAFCIIYVWNLPLDIISGRSLTALAVRPWAPSRKDLLAHSPLYS